jgi:Acyl-CoA dehydrogenase, N-terminal domain.
VARRGGVGLECNSFPENLGGLDFGCMGLGPIFEAIGCNLSATPLLSSVVLSGSLLHLQGNAQQQDRWLSATISGGSGWRWRWTNSHGTTRRKWRCKLWPMATATA